MGKHEPKEVTIVWIEEAADISPHTIEAIMRSNKLPARYKLEKEDIENG